MLLDDQIKSIAIGSFDGIHRGHRTLIDKADALVIIERNSGYLTPGYKRSFFTSKICCFYHFDKIKSLTPEAFIHMLETDFPALETIIVGYDFHFGKGKSGNAQILQSICDKNIMIIEQVCHDGIPVHSRTIKTFLREGKISLANDLLGRKYTIDGEVVIGQGLGKKKLVPTVNLKVKEYQLPLEGVYATRTYIDDIWYSSVSFLGHRGTTDDSFAVETHILDDEIGTVEGKVTLEFLDFIRINHKFNSLESLKKQIEEDIAIAQKLLTSYESN